MTRRPNPDPEDWTYGDGCQCGCGKYPKGERSRFLPGHAQRLKSQGLPVCSCPHAHALCGPNCH